MRERVDVCPNSGLQEQSAAVRESGERVRSAIANSGFLFPQHRLTVNLAPADLRKEGPAYDLPIASSNWPAPSPTSPGKRISTRPTWPKPCNSDRD